MPKTTTNVSARRNNRKPVSFFDSQRHDQSQLYHPEQSQHMIDINENDARLVEQMVDGGSPQNEMIPDEQIGNG